MKRALLGALLAISTTSFAAPSAELVSCLSKADQVWGWESRWGYHCQDVDPMSPPGSSGFQEALNMTVVARQKNFYAHEGNRQRSFDLRDKRDAANPCKVYKVGTSYGLVANSSARIDLYKVDQRCFK
ncbi:hypothetical protein D3C85_1023200 [compost metagenome]